MQRYPEFPFFKTIGNTELKYDVLDTKWMPQLQELLQESANSGQSVGVDEGLADGTLQNPISDDRYAIQVTDKTSGALIGVTLIYPCHLTRSTRPVAAGCYLIVEPSMQGLGIGSSMVALMRYLAWQRGYMALLTRTGAGGAGLRVLLNHDSIPTGVITKSRLTLQGTREPDVVIYKNYRHHDPEQYDRRLARITSEKDIMPTSPTGPPPAWTLDDLDVAFNAVVMSAGGVQVSIQPAILKDVLPLERLIRAAACDGRGFCLDEFKDGYFNRRLLRKSHVLCAKTPDGNVIGGAIFGPTFLCRSKSATMFSVYLVVDGSYRRAGIGRAIFTQVERLAKQQGMMGLFIDNFITDLESTHFLTKCGYVSSATFPMSGYVCEHGLTDTLLWHKIC